MSRDQRAALLEGAITCLSQKGYARTTSRDIVAAAGSHLPAINYYYGSKDRLMGQALAQVFRRFGDAVHQIAIKTRGQDPGERAAALAEQVVLDCEDCCGRPLAIGFIEAIAEAERSPELRSHLADSLEEVRRSLAAIASEHLDASERDRAHTLASLLIALVDGLMIQWLLDPERAPDRTSMRAMVTAALSGALAGSTGHYATSASTHGGSGRSSPRPWCSYTSTTPAPHDSIQ